jgi:hypothetical protein
VGSEIFRDPQRSLNEKVHCTHHKLRTLLKSADGCNGEKKQEDLESQSQSYFMTAGLPPIVRLGVKPFEIHDHKAFFLTEPLL